MMKHSVAGVVLVIAACSPSSIAIRSPHPQIIDSPQPDTARARIQSDSALARIIDSLGPALRGSMKIQADLTLARIIDSLSGAVHEWRCPMPVVRGDSSHDTRMVLKVRPSVQFRGLAPYSVCYNPLFRDSS